MGEAIGQMLPAAVGVAISPMPIVAVVLMLVTPRGRTNGVAFLLGWLVGIGLVGTIVLLVAIGANASEGGETATWVSWLELVLGVLLLAGAIKQWRSRPRGDEEAPTPRWMQALDRFTPAKAAGVGILLSAVNPKNLLLTVAGVTAIAATGIPSGEEAIVLLIFVVIASLGVGTPVVLSLTLGERSRVMLDQTKTWMSHNNAAIMAVLFLVFAAKLIGDAIAGLSASP
jgi:threonine/homoserine/homoserine lactone efflux protein